MTKQNTPPLLALAFRPFFLLASLFAIIAMLIWMTQYSFGYQFNLAFNSTLWHSHEMIFGYSMAVIAGFLLTAVKNWTGIQTIHGRPLLALALCWVLARIMPFLPFSKAAYWMAAFDIAFLLGLSISFAIPVFKSKQWKQLGILSKLMLFLISNIIFYLGLFNILESGVQWGLNGGFYMVIALIFMMARRVIPFFIEKGLGAKTVVNNSRLIDISSLVLFVVFAVSDIFLPGSYWVVTSASILLLIHLVRLVMWYRRGIWAVPLIWVLYVSYGFLTLAFALKLAVIFYAISPFIALHAFAVGGIGVMTLGMMSRVTLGHTGRNINNPPRLLPVAMIAIILSAGLRVVAPLLLGELYLTWILTAQIFWIIAFCLFVFIFATMLLRPRIDGLPG